MRLFIAVNFTADTRSRLLELRDELRSRSVRGHFSPSENLHLTLAFLGECDVKQTAVIKDVMDTTVFEPFPISVERVGRFKRGDSDIWWAGLQESKALIDLQKDLTEQLTAAGFTVDKRAYNPHVTLGREVVTDTQPYKIQPFGEIVASIELMKSERVNGKLTYTAIYERNNRK